MNSGKSHWKYPVLASQCRNNDPQAVVLTSKPHFHKDSPTPMLVTQCRLSQGFQYMMRTHFIAGVFTMFLPYK